MGNDRLSADLRQWILAQARQGQSPATVVDGLKGQGWDEDEALDLVQEVLQSYLADHAREHGLPVPSAVPEPMELDGPRVVDVDGHPVTVLADLMHPRVVVLGRLLADEECDALVALAQGRMQRSEAFLVEEGVSVVHQDRTSEGMFFMRGENELCRRIEARIAALCQWPIENGEGLQVLRYGPGAEYKPHFDYFDPDKAGTRKVIERGGQRVASLVMYLNTPRRGGATTFPDARFEVSPIKGNAVFFSYDRPHPMTGTRHGGAPVLEGEKWVATKWLRERPFI